MSKFKNKLIVNVYAEDSYYVTYMLDKLGYITEYENPPRSICGGVVTENSGIYYTTFGRSEFKLEDPSYINCGDNIELFLSLAAMREDMDKYQLFVSEASCSWVNIGIWQNKGDFTLCLVDDYYMGENGKFLSGITPAHKASVDEIKNYLLLNPKYRPYKSWYEKTSVEAILKSVADLSEKMVKQEDYIIHANRDMYECLKKESIGFSAPDNDMGFFVMFRQRPIKVYLDNTQFYKMVLFKNKKPYIFVDNNGYVHRYDEFDGINTENTV